jgi:hypothetical protein
MKPFRSNAALTALAADSSGLGLDVETNPPTPVIGEGLSLDIPLHRTRYPTMRDSLWYRLFATPISQRAFAGVSARLETSFLQGRRSHGI